IHVRAIGPPEKGTLPLAALFYVYYERTDVQDRRTRPLFISFNGGPGSSSVWMHMGYTGPPPHRHRRRGQPHASTFFGVEADIEYLGRWIQTFVTRYDRWGSPKYLIGA